jgi:predicted  nucleic acid-binding Zn-ribbon protein
MPSRRISHIRSYVTNSDTHFHRSINLNNFSTQDPTNNSNNSNISSSSNVISLPKFEVPTSLVPSVDELENSDQLVKEQMENIVKQITQNHNSILVVNELVKNVGETTNTNKTEITNLNQQIITANTNIANTNGQIAKNTNELSNIINKVTNEIPNEVNNLQKSIINNKNKIDNVEENLANTTNDVNAKIGSLQTASTNLTNEINKINNNLASTNQQLSNANTQLANANEQISKNSNTLTQHTTLFDNINKNIVDHNEKITLINNEIAVLKASNITTTDTNTTDKNTNANTTETTTTQIDSSAIAVLDASVNNLYEEISLNKKNISAVDEQTADLSKSSTNNSVEIMAIKGTLTNLDNKTTTNLNEINSTKEKLNWFDNKNIETTNEINSLKENVTTLTNNTASNTSNILNVVEQVNSVNQLAANNSTEIAEISKKLSEVSSGAPSTTTENSTSTATSTTSSASNVFNNVKNMCCTILSTFAPLDTYKGGSYTGSGSFITLKDADLVNGLFLTCAHMVMQIVGDKLHYAEHIYIENPLNKEWLRVTPDMIYSDGVGDISIIKTNINLSTNDTNVKPLKLASQNANTGDTCFVVGDPAGLDSDSITQGIIRSGNYTMKPISNQINECLFIDAPTMSGNSGSPILNSSCEIIGMLTFGTDTYSTFGGGPNVNSLSQSLSILSQFKNNKDKKYLGVKWGVVYPMTLYKIKDTINPLLSTTIRGLEIKEIDPLSPFSGQLNVGDIILSAKTFDGTNTKKNEYTFGVHDDEVTLGILLYKYDIVRIELTCISASNGQTNVKQISMAKTYADVPPVKDIYLSGGLGKKVE